MKVLIDPYMFELTDEIEIRSNISFFRTVINLASNVIRQNAISIALYRGMIEKIQQRTIQPFPINPSDIQDQELRKMIMQVNHSFNTSLIRVIEGLDIDECDGDQSFEVLEDSQLAQDDNYYEMLCMLLIPCYSKKHVFDRRILTGEKKAGRQVGDIFGISCQCDSKKYSSRHEFTNIADFVSKEEKAIKKLKEKKKNNELLLVETVMASMGDHHNHVSATKKDFKSLNDLSAKNKNVLSLLQKIGLKQIIFGKFTGKGVRAVGTMNIQTVRNEATQDIVVVKFYSETGMQIETDLYFPKGVGTLLQEYFQDKLMEYQNVHELIEKI